LEEITSVLPFLIPVIIIELALMVVALVDVLRRQENRVKGNKIVWVFVIIFIQIFGPVAYFIFGRKESVVDSD